MPWITGNSIDIMRRMIRAGGGGRYDVMIADPPYDDPELINGAIALGRSLAKVSFFFMYAENLPRLDDEPDQVLFWVKPISTKNTKKRYSRFVEVICAYGLDESPFNQDTHWSTRSGVFTDSLIGEQRHPYEKPESLIEKLLAVNAPDEASVIDPFAGSGTVARVCDRLGHTCVSIEIQPRKRSAAHGTRKD